MVFRDGDYLEKDQRLVRGMVCCGLYSAEGIKGFRISIISAGTVTPDTTLL